MLRRVAFGILLWFWVLAICGADAAGSLPRLASPAPLELNLGAAGSVVVAPVNPGYRQIADELMRGIKDATGRPPRIVSDDAEPTTLGAGPLMVLGNLLDSRLARKLYLDACKWTLVIDRAVVHRPGELLAERHWHLCGQLTPRPNGLTSIRGTACLHLDSVGLSPEGMSGTDDRKEVLRTMAESGRPVEIASLLQLNQTPDRCDARLTQAGPGWRIEAPERAEFVVVDRTAGSHVYVVTDRGVATRDPSH